MKKNNDHRLTPLTFFSVVTMMLILPLGIVYSWQSDGLRLYAVNSHIKRMGEQLDQWQDRLRGMEWAALTDAADDAAHLGHYNEQRLLEETMRWQIDGPGPPVYEGVAVVDIRGRIRPSAVTAAMEMGRETLSGEGAGDGAGDIRAFKPWLERPWLDSYEFVIQGLADSQPGNRGSEAGKGDIYISPFIAAPGRQVVVVGAATRDPSGRITGAVIAQLAATEVIDRLLRSSFAGRNVWVVDRLGRLGAATTGLARNSARSFTNGGGLERALSEGGYASARGLAGSGGSGRQHLERGPVRVVYRTIGDRLVLGAVETEATLGLWSRQVVRNMGVTAVSGMIALAVCAAIFTIVALKRESRLVELRTLGRSAGTMSHNIGNSLTSLRANLELISSGRIGDTGVIRSDLAPAMETSLDGIEHTLTALRKLSRAEAAPAYDGQVGHGTLYRIDCDDELGGTKKVDGGGRRRGRAPFNRHVAGDRGV